MAMTVSYSVVPRKNPAKKSEPAKYYAQAQASGELDFEELCEAITSRSTCTETDVRAAISGILYEVKRALKAGRIARLGDLGSLQIGLNSEGAASVKEFSGSMIKGAHLIFRPGKTLAELMSPSWPERPISSPPGSMERTWDPSPCPGMRRGRRP